MSPSSPAQPLADAFEPTALGFAAYFFGDPDIFGKGHVHHPASGQCIMRGYPRTLAAPRFFSHLDDNLLAGLQQRLN